MSIEQQPTTEQLFELIATAPTPQLRKAWCSVLYQRGIIDGLEIAKNSADAGIQCMNDHEKKIVEHAESLPRLVV